MVPVGEFNASSSRVVPQLIGENVSSWTGLRTKEECIVQATISPGFLFERFAFSHVCASRGAVLRQVTTGDNLNNITTRQAAYVVASQQ
jgi:hypothetical protein